MSDNYKELKLKDCNAIVSINDHTFGSAIGLHSNNHYPDTGFMVDLDEWELFKAFVDKSIAELSKDG